MIPGTQTLDAVLTEAKKHVGHLARTFDVPVLLVVTEDVDLEGATVVTAPGTRTLKAGEPMKASTTFVVPIQPRYPNAGSARLSFGRSAVCDVVLPFSPVSKHHGYFQQEKGVWYAVDVGSTNGTTVDGKKASHASPVVLNEGSTLHLGQVAARFLTAQGFVSVLKHRLGVKG